MKIKCYEVKDMNGVEILAINEIVAETTFNWVAFLIPFCIVVALFLGIGFLFSSMYKDKSNILIGMILGIAFGCVFGCMCGFGFGNPVAYENQYKVIISDEVHMNDFLEKYEVLDQEGKIYTVRERLQK